MRVALTILVTLAVTVAFAADKLTVDSSQGAKPYPVWVEKAEKITFAVKGTWTMWDRWAPVDYNGHTSFKKVGSFYLGQLIGRVEGGPEFTVTDGLTYTSPVSGRLVLYPNRGNYAHLATAGALTVNVTGGKPVTDSQAEKLTGWDIAALDTARGETYLSGPEKDVVLFLNKARSNPPLFARMYLGTRKESGGYALECYNEMLAAKPLHTLAPSKALSLAARDHATDMGSTGGTGHTSSSGADAAARVKKYGDFTGPYTGPWENCSYGAADPLEIMLQLLIDDGVPSRGHRKNIFEKNVNFVGVSIKPHKTYRNNCVMDFADSIKDR